MEEKMLILFVLETIIYSPALLIFYYLWFVEEWCALCCDRWDAEEELHAENTQKHQTVDVLLNLCLCRVDSGWSYKSQMHFQDNFEC